MFPPGFLCTSLSAEREKLKTPWLRVSTSWQQLKHYHVINITVILNPKYSTVLGTRKKNHPYLSWNQDSTHPLFYSIYVMLKSHTFQYTITFPVFCYIHRGSATGDMWIGLLDLWVAAHWSGHNKSSLAWLIPSGTGDFSEWQSIFLSIIISSLQGYFSFTLDRSCLQRLRTCIPFPSALPKPPALENYPSCLAFFLSNSRLIASSSHH